MSFGGGSATGIAAGLAFAALGGAITAGALNFERLGMATAAGPALFPLLVGPGLAVVGLLLTMAEMRRRRGRALVAGMVAQIRWRRLAAVMAGVASFIVLIRPAGLVAAGGTLFLLASLAFGGHLVRDMLIGLVVATVAWGLFAALLGLPVPGLPAL